MQEDNYLIGKWISMLYRYAQNYVAKELKSYHIGSGQFIFLVILLHKDGISQEGLSHMLNMDKGTTARAIHKLEKEGYVIRKTDMEDRRAYKLFVTEKARLIKPVLWEILSQWNKILAADFSQDEKKMVLNLLKRMVQNVETWMKE